jgi:hypothetical protein
VVAKPTRGSIAAGLTVPERLLLLCLASDTDWQKVAGVTHATARQMMVRGLIERHRTATRYVLTDQGRGAGRFAFNEGRDMTERFDGDFDP